MQMTEYKFPEYTSVDSTKEIATASIITFIDYIVFNNHESGLVNFA
jgi:hypothetical protein